ncbi:MAG: hypothetical protein AAF902_17090 [Chloroflexota bacterium]
MIETQTEDKDNIRNILSRVSGADWMVISFVLILIGYFLPWLNHRLAGLTLIGLDISEWLKFLPQFASGELPNRNYFYLPPLILGALLILWSAVEIQDSKRGWIVSAVGILIALIAMPALEALPLNGEALRAADEWLFRLVGIALVGGLFLIRPILTKIPSTWLLAMMSLLSVVGIVLPGRLLYLSRSAYIFWLRLTPNPGLGFALHVIGSLGVVLACWQYYQRN